MATVYVESSIVSARVTDKTDPASLYHRTTTEAWWRTQAHRHQLFVSAEVIAELSASTFTRRERALELIGKLPLIAIDEEVRGLARMLVREKAMPAPIAGDAIHVAAACVHEMEYLLSWNVRHLANPRKLEHLQGICLRLGRMPPRIVTPELLWEESDEERV